jgi:hypothetical protein
MFTWKRITALAIVVAGAVGAFAVYTFGWRDTGRDPATLTRCESSGEAGIQNLFCARAGTRSRYQVVFWSDAVDVYDLARNREPMVPTFSVPAKLKRAPDNWDDLRRSSSSRRAS